MSLDNLLVVCKNFYYLHTYVSLAIIAGLLLFLWFHTKATLKIIGAILIFVLVIYCFSILGKTSSSGMAKEKQMINQTVDRMK